MTSTLGFFLKQLRSERKLTQAELGTICGVCPRTISAIETNRLKGNVLDLARLAGALDVELSSLVSHPGRRLFTSPLDEHFRQRAYWRPRPDREGIQRKTALEEVCPKVLRPLLDAVASRPDGPEACCLLSLVASDSAPEWMVLLQRLAVGDYPTSFAPLEVGFRRLAVVCPKSRRVVGDCPVPGVAGEAAGMRFLMLPHVGVATRPAVFTLDILLIVQVNGKRYEIDLEIDGKKHLSTWDVWRRETLGMQEIRFSIEDVLRPDFNVLLLTAIHQTCQGGPGSVPPRSGKPGFFENRNGPVPGAADS